MSENKPGFCHQDARLLQPDPPLSVDLVQNKCHLELAHHGLKLMLEPSGDRLAWTA
jgi:hypothetical protein